MNSKFSLIWEIIGAPVIFLLVFLALASLWGVFDLPTKDELVGTIDQYFDLYGYWVLFISAIVEGMLLAGWYYPGSLVVILGVVFAGKNIPEVAVVVVLVTIGLYLAYLFNYWLGRHGWYRLLMGFGLRKPINIARDNLGRHGLSGIFLSYWQPNLAALASTAAGILHFPFKRFALYSAGAVIVWDIFWAILVYFFGDLAISIVGLRFVIVIVAALIIYRLFLKLHEHNNN